MKRLSMLQGNQSETPQRLLSVQHCTSSPLLRLRHALFGCTALLATVTACNSSSLPLEPVTGHVTYQGKPLTRGEVVFMPEKGTPGPPAVGPIDAEGNYRMQTSGEDGASVGAHKVMVHSRREITPEESDNLIVPPSLIPEVYGRPNESELSFEVKSGEENVYDITLQ